MIKLKIKNKISENIIENIEHYENFDDLLNFLNDNYGIFNDDYNISSFESLLNSSKNIKTIDDFKFYFHISKLLELYNDAQSIITLYNKFGFDKTKKLLNNFNFIGYYEKNKLKKLLIKSKFGLEINDNEMESFNFENLKNTQNEYIIIELDITNIDKFQNLTYSKLYYFVFKI